MRLNGLILVTLFLMAPGLASGGDTADFNQAWTDYVAAMETKDLQRREVAARGVAEAGKTVFEETDERLTLVTQNYGVALMENGNGKQAVPILKEAVRLGEGVYGAEGSGLVPILVELADAEARAYEPNRQLRHYRRALNIVETNNGKQSIEYANLAFRTARHVYELSLSDAARNHMQAAKDIFESLPEPNLQNVALADFFLGKMAFSDRNYRRSTEHLESALTEFEGPDSNLQTLRLLTRALLVQNYENRGQSDKATEHCVAIGRESQISPDQDYRPLFRMAPQYPATMLQRGKTGYVDLAFTVNKSGFVTDAVVEGRSVDGRELKGKSDFDKPALEAVQRFRYAPRFIDGEAVDSENVKTRIRFEIEG
ncbi:MAG: TonB family protein [Pseudomonadota bacterium]